MTEVLRKVNIDGTEYEMPGYYTLMQACEEAGAEIPRFCYHERLSVAGNCRMCLVEWVGAPKPMASCAMSLNDLRPNRDGSPADIRTNTATVKKAREGVMEFLLINHPLDCPICDQGGECDLQDQAVGYGRSMTRYDEDKRAVEEKNMGPLVKTNMTRCIQCTRCVRFITEVAGVEELGLVNRGENAEITTYLQANLTSELSGNVIDLCPVGALTSRPYAFNARPWELRKTESIDVMDAVGSAIRVDARGSEVMRILPRLNEEINEEWISDKTRFVWDGLKRQRLDKPYIRVNGRLRPASWDDALAVVAKRLKGDPDRIGAIAGDLADMESIKALKDLMESLGIRSMDCRQDGAQLGEQGRGGYIFNSGIAGIDQADAILLVGTNPRLEAPIINARIRKAWLDGGAEIGVVGSASDLTYPYAHLGDGPDVLDELAKKRHPFTKAMRDAKRPMIIIGMDALKRSDGAQILRAVGKLAAEWKLVQGDWNGFNVLHDAAARVGALDLGFLPRKNGMDTSAMLKAADKGDLDTLFLLGADELDMTKTGKSFVIYLGSHGDAGAHRADVVLPGLAYTEKNATYANTEGRWQQTRAAVSPKGDAKEDWKILRALSDAVGRTLPYDDVAALRATFPQNEPTKLELAKLGKAGKIKAKSLAPKSNSFWFTNPIARASEIMAQCAGAENRRLEAAE
ncbi:MAG: NADH-quinone oxidoreductase subunit G [Robiginitomaculum sp.]|nr:MAG: NADH-quinone oxidoreductase subunit G [Robiginitomaculum sp.]